MAESERKPSQMPMSRSQSYDAVEFRVRIRNKSEANSNELGVKCESITQCRVRTRVSQYVDITTLNRFSRHIKNAYEHRFRNKFEDK